MSRYAKPGVTTDDLKKAIEDDEKYGNVFNLVMENERIRKDLSKISVDFENTDPIGEYAMPGTEDLKPYEMIGDLAVAWCACGGDWEQPLVFVIYMGADGKLRGYIPTKGNAYNTKTKAAYGNEPYDEKNPPDIGGTDDYDGMDYEDWIDEHYHFDADALREDVKNRIVFKS